MIFSEIIEEENPLEDWLVITGHGFNVRDNAEGTTDRLLPYFDAAGLDSVDFDYGFFDLLKVRFGSDRVAKNLTEFIRGSGKRCIVVGHSHFNAILHLATTKYNAPIEYWIGLNPALNVNTVLDKRVRKVDVYHTQYDTTVTWAKWLRRLSPISWVEPHLWGEAGRYGVNDTRVNCVDMANTPGMPIIKGHSHIFKYKNLRRWGPYLTYKILNFIQLQEGLKHDTKIYNDRSRESRRRA